MFKCVNALPRVCVAQPSATEIIRIGKKGDEKMTMIEMKKYDDTTTNAIPTVAGRLPELDEEGVGMAQSHQQLAWCHGFMDNHKDGQMFYMESCGVHLQRVNETESRCVAIVDHSTAMQVWPC